MLIWKQFYICSLIYLITAIEEEKKKINLQKKNQKLAHIPGKWHHSWQNGTGALYRDEPVRSPPCSECSAEGWGSTRTSAGTSSLKTVYRKGAVSEVNSYSWVTFWYVSVYILCLYRSKCNVNPFGVRTDDSSHNFKADERIVLKEFDKRKRQQREILWFSEDGRPVCQSGQDPAGERERQRLEDIFPSKYAIKIKFMLLCLFISLSALYMKTTSVKHSFVICTWSYNENVSNTWIKYIIDNYFLLWPLQSSLQFVALDWVALMQTHISRVQAFIC